MRTQPGTDRALPGDQPFDVGGLAVGTLLGTTGYSRTGCSRARRPAGSSTTRPWGVCYEAASPALATLLRDDFVHAYERELPALVTRFLGDFDACIAHLSFPLRHRKVIRTTNVLERLFLEERRRTRSSRTLSASVRSSN